MDWRRMPIRAIEDLKEDLLNEMKTQAMCETCKKRKADWCDVCQWYDAMMLVNDMLDPENIESVDESVLCSSSRPRFLASALRLFRVLADEKKCLCATAVIDEVIAFLDEESLKREQNQAKEGSIE